MGNTDELYGTESDGTKSRDYCKFCYMDGKFTNNCTMDEMIEICVPFMVKNCPNYTPSDARELMEEVFPKLKRWQ